MPHWYKKFFLSNQAIDTAGFLLSGASGLLRCLFGKAGANARHRTMPCNNRGQVAQQRTKARKESMLHVIQLLGARGTRIELILQQPRPGGSAR